MYACIFKKKIMIIIFFCLFLNAPVGDRQLSKPRSQVDNGPSSAPASDSGADEVDLAGRSPLALPPRPPSPFCPSSPSTSSTTTLCDKDNSLCVVCDDIYNEPASSPMSMATSDNPAGCALVGFSDTSVSCPVNTEDDLLDDFFKFVSSGTCLSSLVDVCRIV